MNITVSPEAIINIRRLQKEYESESNALRFGLSTSGCSGYKYVLEVIGWKETLFLSGFDIDNPQAEQPCGCGESINFIEEENNEV